jgi:hypothetical protein
VGLMKDNQLMRDIFGHTHAQRTKATLDRTFHEFLGVLEESINNELSHSIQLFGLFEAIDKQFLNLQRTVIREQDQQERLEGDFLSSLWTKVIGVNASLLRKYQKNKDLLASVRDRTVRNKYVLVDHNQRLLQLKSNLEILRRKLVSPLVRSENGSTLSIEEQVRGLEGTYSLLKSTREVQKRKMMEIVYGSGCQNILAPIGYRHRHPVTALWLAQLSGARASCLECGRLVHPHLAVAFTTVLATSTEQNASALICPSLSRNSMAAKRSARP